MAYDGNSFYGDMIVDEYDERNNLMNPPSPVGFLFYHILGDGFDMMSEMCSQFMNDFSILTASTKGLDNYWGVSYNMPRPKIHHDAFILFEDKGTIADHTDNYSIASGNVIKTVTDTGTVLEGGDGTGAGTLEVNEIFSNDFQIEFIYNPINHPARHTFVLTDERNRRYEILCYYGNVAGSNSPLSLNVQNIPDEEEIYEGGKVTIKKVMNEISVYFNNQLTGSMPIGEHDFSFSFELYGGGMLSFSDLKILDITADHEQLLTDDEYKVYLYLRNCRLMTREDIEINMNKCFGIYDDHASYEVYFSEEIYGLTLSDHLNYNSLDTVSSNLHINNDDESADFVTDFSNDEETMLILGGLSTTEDKVNVVNIPYQGWDTAFLEFLEEYISIKGNLKIKEYNL